MINVIEVVVSINKVNDELCDQIQFNQPDSEILTSQISQNNVTFLQITYFFINTAEQQLFLLTQIPLTVDKFYNIH